MKVLVGTYELYNRRSKSFEDAYLYSPIVENHVSDFETLWVPAFETRLAQAKTWADVAAANAQDHHWKWRKKTQQRQGRLDWKSFAIECDSSTQGLMFAITSAFAREPSQKNQHIIYIDLLATAPWNRHGMTNLPKYKGVGRLLLLAAINLSVSEGFVGRIGLHSLPQSESWYRDICGMTDLGIDQTNPSSLRYFEMTQTQMETFLT